MKIRIERIKKFVTTHPTAVSFGAGVVVGGYLMRDYRGKLAEDLSHYENLADKLIDHISSFEQDMHLRVSMSQLHALMSGATKALISPSGEEHGGDIIITLK